MLGQSVTSALIFIFLLKKMLDITGKIKLRFKRLFFPTLKSSIWIFLLTLVPILFQNSSAFLLGSFVSPFQLGLYFGAAKIHLSFNALYGPIGQAVYPRLVLSNEISRYESKKLTVKFFWFMLSLGLLFFAIIFLFSNKIIMILLGSEFIEASNTLKLFGLVLPLTAVSHVLGRQWLIIQKNDKIFSIITLFSFLFTVIFLILTIEFLGINAIPISLIIFELITIFIILIRISK